MGNKIEMKGFNKIKKYGLVLILFTYFTQIAFSQDKDSINLYPKWNIGETLVYRMVSSDIHQNSKGYAINILQDTQYIFIKPVKIREDKNIILRVNYRDSKELTDSFLEFRNLTKNHESVVVVDPTGKFVEVINWKFFSYKYIEINARNLEKGLVDSAAYKFFNSFYSSQVNMESIVIEDLNKLLLGFGSGYTLGNTYLTQRKLPNPFKGKALIVNGTTKLSRPTESKNTVKLYNKSGTDETHAVGLSEDFLNNQKQKGTPYKFIPPQFYIGNEEEFYYNIPQGRISFCSIKDSLISEIESRIVAIDFALIDILNP